MHFINRSMEDLNSRKNLEIIQINSFINLIEQLKNKIELINKKKISQ